MDERDKRYTERFSSQEKAVDLAKAAANAGKGTVNIAVLASVVSLILYLLDKLK